MKPMSPLVTVLITSFGYRHGVPPVAAVTLDVRKRLRDPHVDLRLRQLTGQDPAVRARVLGTPGVPRLVAHTTALVAALVEDTTVPLGDRVDLAIGCAGGRHRSVVLAEMICGALALAGIRADVHHRDVHRPVLPASANDSSSSLT